MTKWIACGSFTNPKSRGEYFRFSSKVSHALKEEAEAEAEAWKSEKRYTYIWIEEGK